MIKKIKYLLSKFDGVWSFPLAVAAFFLVGILLSGGYDWAFIQPFFLSVAVVVGAANAATYGLYFTFRGLYRFIYGEKENGVVKNKSKEVWQQLKPVQQLGIAFGAFFLLFFSILIVFVSIV